MIERVIEFSIRNRFLVIAAWIGIGIWGVFALRHTPVDAIPDLSENQVIVFTDWMGRSPREIEDQITYPLSVNLQGLAGVKAVRSSSEFNFSMINVIFDDAVDFYFARTRVMERLALAGTFLPSGVTPYLAPDATALGQIFWYTVEGDNRNPDELRAIQDWFVRYQLNSVPGVAQVSSVGGFPREYQVDVDPEKMRAFRVTLGELVGAIGRSNSAVGGRVVHKNNAEYLVRGVGWITSLDDIRGTVIAERAGVPVTVREVANVGLGPEFRRSVLEKDGREVVGGVVMMRFGENPLEVTGRVKEKIRELQKGLPDGVKIVPFYDRTRLITGALTMVTKTLLEALLIASIAILLILNHLRSAFVVCITLPLAVLASFILMRHFGIASNIMSLAGIAISIGVLVDPAIVMVENTTHHLTRVFKDGRVSGDTTELVVGPCREVGRPIFFSILIMLVSFLPVFSLSGMEGKMFHPLAFTKTFAMVGVSVLAITLVPALIPLFVRGRLRHETDNWIVRTFIEVYRPVLMWLLHKPKLVLWLFVCLLGLGVYFWRQSGREFMPSLDEGSILDMPVSAPRLSVTQAADDLKLRDAVIREFPEVEGVVGKSGRADTPTDPSPLDMVESIIGLRPREAWPQRHLRYADALAQNLRTVDAFMRAGFLKPDTSPEDRSELAKSAMNASTVFDAHMRKITLRRMHDFEDQLGRATARELATFTADWITRNGGWLRKPKDDDLRKLSDGAVEIVGTVFRRGILLTDVDRAVSALLLKATADGLTSSPAHAIAGRAGLLGETWKGFRETMGFGAGDFQQQAAGHLEEFQRNRWASWIKDLNWQIFDEGMPVYAAAAADEIRDLAKDRNLWTAPSADVDAYRRTVAQVGREFASGTFLWQASKGELLKELDTRVRMVGWVNIWTQPIINRIDMLATGVRTQVGVKVYGPDPDTIQKVSNQVSSVLREVPGAVDVVADQTVGKGYVEILVDRARAARYGVSVGDVQDVIEVALGGKPITTTVEGRERYPVRVRYGRDFREDEESIRRIQVVAGSGSMPSPTMGGAPAPMGSPAPPPQSTASPSSRSVSLGDVAEVRVVEGPVMIKSENGLLRSYVQLNVRDRDIVGFVEEARRIVDAKVAMQPGVYVEWSGQFEHQVRARRTLTVVFPAVILLIFVILFITYNDLADALLMMMAVPGALAGGVLFQHLFGYNFSVAVWVGYIACFGMATETGIIMLVYLRDAIAARGGLEAIASLDDLARAVTEGAVHRLRPKLLTEGAAIVGLAPLVWAHGVGAEVIQPMAAPVLGGLLIADEVIDIFIPVLFYHVRAGRWRKLHPQTDQDATNGSPATAAPKEVN